MSSQMRIRMRILAVLLAGMCGFFYADSGYQLSKIAFSQAVYSCGDVERGCTMNTSIILSNNTTRSVQITASESSCGCALLVNSGSRLNTPFTIPPGSSVKRDLKLSSQNRIGPQQAELALVTANGQRVATVARWNVLSSLDVFPEFVSLGRIRPGERCSKIVSIRATNRAVPISSVHSSHGESLIVSIGRSRQRGTLFEEQVYLDFLAPKVELGETRALFMFVYAKLEPREGYPKVVTIPVDAIVVSEIQFKPANGVFTIKGESKSKFRVFAVLDGRFRNSEVSLSSCPKYLDVSISLHSESEASRVFVMTVKADPTAEFSNASITLVLKPA